MKYENIYLKIMNTIFPMLYIINNSGYDEYVQKQKKKHFFVHYVVCNIISIEILY